jgi:tripartite-type tricarboxylate transporter receptor subunit TctC
MAMLLACLAISGKAAAAYPDHPITLVVPYPPGASTDSLARAVAAGLGKTLNTPVVVENRPGGETTIGTGIAKRAAPDGYTILFQAGTFMTALSSLKQPGYALSDFKPISPLIKTAFVLLAPTSLPTQSLDDYFVYARQHQSAMNNGTLGAGATIYKVMGEAVQQAGGFKWTDIPYKGGMEGVQAVIAGEIQAYFATVSLAVSQRSQPRLKPLAIADTRRSIYLPDVPTFAELGHPDVIGSSLYGLYVRADTPAGIRTTLEQAMHTVMASDAMKQSMTALSLDPYPGTLQDFDKEVHQTARKFHDDAQRLGLQPR